MEPESVRTYKGLLLPGLGFISDEFSWEEEEISNSARTNKNIWRASHSSELIFSVGEN